MPFLDPRRTAQGPMLPLLALPRAERLFAWGLARLTPEQLAEQVLLACFGDTAKVNPQRRVEAIEEIKLRHTVEHYPRAYLGTLRGLVSSFLRAYLPGADSQWRLAARITAPTLVIGGLRDELVDPRVPSAGRQGDTGRPAADPAGRRPRRPDGGSASGRAGRRRAAGRRRFRGRPRRVT
nr:hypothetical protein GCM10020092_100490 [Actinoplanes digitatis]